MVRGTPQKCSPQARFGRSLQPEFFRRQKKQGGQNPQQLAEGLNGSTHQGVDPVARFAPQKVTSKR